MEKDDLSQLSELHELTAVDMSYLADGDKAKRSLQVAEVMK